ncbi:helix-turn-helix domain-containing protein [Clostridium tertium]
MNFTDRLKKFRNEKGLNQTELGELIGVKKSYYSQIENNKKSPSRNFINSLVAISGLPEEYWLYGVEEKDYVNDRIEYKCIQRAFEQILELNIIDDVNKLRIQAPEGSIEELIVSAIKADLEHLINKKKGKK